MLEVGYVWCGEPSLFSKPFSCKPLNMVSKPRVYTFSLYCVIFFNFNFFFLFFSLAPIHLAYQINLNSWASCPWEEMAPSSLSPIMWSPRHLQYWISTRCRWQNWCSCCLRWLVDVDGRFCLRWWLELSMVAGDRCWVSLIALWVVIGCFRARFGYHRRILVGCMVSEVLWAVVWASPACYRWF